jgi:hypothetical protein
MPDISNIEKILSSLKTDSSKILGVTVGTTTVTPGLYIPKAGTYHYFTLPVKVKNKIKYVFLVLPGSDGVGSGSGRTHTFIQRNWSLHSRRSWPRCSIPEHYGSGTNSSLDSIWSEARWCQFCSVIGGHSIRCQVCIKSLFLFPGLSSSLEQIIITPKSPSTPRKRYNILISISVSSVPLHRHSADPIATHFSSTISLQTSIIRSMRLLVESASGTVAGWDMT